MYSPIVPILKVGSAICTDLAAAMLIATATYWGTPSLFIKYILFCAILASVAVIVEHYIVTSLQSS